MIIKTDKLIELLDDETDPLVITPQPARNTLLESGAASVDFRLGTWFVTLKQARMGLLNIGDERRRIPQFTKTHYVPFGAKYYLHPQAFVLGVTLEWIRVPAKLAAYVVGKSGLGRCGLIIATATGVHPGFKGCLTLEITNVGNIPVVISPGMKICQVFFHSVDSLDDTLLDKSQFVGLRKPVVGKVERDDIALRLAQAYAPKDEQE